MAPRQEAAPFVPISPTINIPHLLSTTPNFKPVQRIDARRINPTNLESLQVMIHEHVVTKGIPLVIENWHLRPDWQKWVFNFDWLKGNHGADQVNIRDIPNKADIPMTLGHYLNNMAKLTSKFSPSNYDGHQQRLYGKDLDCPPVWRTSLENVLPNSTFYLSPRADLMSSLPKDARAENMMCYIGHEGTYTPAHTEMCATLGQNIMIAASSEGANSEKGSSLWFMTQMADRDVVAEYWMGTLGHDLSVEAHFASLDDLRNAPFTVYILEQRVGDYVLVPPLAPHQVWNRGTYTIKAAWNRVTVDTLEHAMREALPKIRLVCRDEQYKTRAIIYDTLRIYTKALLDGDEGDLRKFPPTIKDDYIKLYNLFTSILLDECFSPLLPKENKVELIPNEYNVTCSFCRGNIFNRFLSCKRCPPSMEGLEEDPYDVCMDCYARGRSCFCVSGLTWVEQHSWVELLTDHEKFRTKVIEIEKEKNEEAVTPPQFSQALANLNRKSLARVCQEALQTRPYLDPDDIGELDDEREIARKKKDGTLLACHTCGNRHPSWKAMLCTTKDCGKAYCFGNLWRAYDMDPFDDCLGKHYWKCPVCLGFCSCGRCRKKPGAHPYIPKCTILGAVTKHVADPRSIESLVDFGKGNVGWLTNGVSGGKRKQGEGEGEYGGAISKWGPAFGAPDTADPDGVTDPEEPSIPEEFNDRNVVAAPMGYKAHFGAAGLDVASVPIDPTLGFSGFQDGYNLSKKGLNGDYVKMFENPPDIPVSPRRYYGHTEGTMLSSDGPTDEIGTSHQQPIMGAINPALSGEIQLGDGNHEGNSWNVPRDAPTPRTTGLSTLEKNPLAFLAAAGLMHSQQQEEQGMVAQNEWITPYPYDGPALHPTETFPSDDEQDAPSEPYGLSGIFQHYQPHIDPALLSGTEKGKGKSKKPPMSKKERREKVQGDIDLEPVEQTVVAEWVKSMKSKKSRKKKGSLIVVLKISPEAWKRHDAQVALQKEEKARKLAARFGLDDVGTDLSPDPKRRRTDGATKSPTGKRRGRPFGSRKSNIGISDDEDERVGANELLSDDEDIEIMPKKTQRSNRTGELVGGLTFEPSRRVSLNKSSKPTPPTRVNVVSRNPHAKKGDNTHLEAARTSTAYDDESMGEDSTRDEMPIGRSPSVSSMSNHGGNEADLDSGGPKPGTEAYRAKIQKALQDAKRMALAAAEGRSPPQSVYSSEAQSRAESEESEGSEDDNNSFQISIGPKRPSWVNEKKEYTPVRTGSLDSSQDKSASPVVGDVRPIPPKLVQATPKIKPALRPSRPLSKRGRPKKADTKKMTVHKTPTTASPKASFTPINPSLASIPINTAKRGRPRKDSSTAGTSPDISVPIQSPPAKRPRNGISSTPKKPAPINSTGKPRGRPPRNSLSTPTSSINSAPVSAPTSVGAAKSATPKKKPGRPSKSSISGIESLGLKIPGKPTAPVINPTALDASRSRNVLELLRHSPPANGEDDDDDWF
ncbi:hypothetical protein ABW19_dt0209290 [Dactylella cylindrospora]|nr:hypothetical protein ABW19_dt0209290 [Dactylella cylindrospora]